MQINEALKRFRKNTGLNQTEMANKIGIKQQQYSDYERGKNTMSAKYVVDICKAFDVSADYLLGLSDIDKKYSNNEQGNSSDI